MYWKGNAMQAKFKGKLVEVWKISHRPVYETWVKQAFEKSILSWNERNQNVLNFESGDLALVGDFLVREQSGEFQVVSEERVSQKLDILEFNM